MQSKVNFFKQTTEPNWGGKLLIYSCLATVFLQER